MRSFALGLLVGAISIAAGGHVASAAEIKVLTAGAMRGVVVALIPDFEKQTGHKVTIDNATAGALAKRIAGGEAFDVAIVTPVVVDDLASKGKIVPGSRIDLAKVGMGVAVKEGAAVPDIGTVDAFKRTLLAARSVAYIDPKAGGSSGIYFDKLLDRLGIGGDIRPKAKLKQGGYVAELGRQSSTPAMMSGSSRRSQLAAHSRAASKADLPVRAAASFDAFGPVDVRIAPGACSRAATPVLLFQINAARRRPVPGFKLHLGWLVETKMFKHILIATDGSELAQKAVAQGLELASELKAKVLAVTVTEPWAMIGGLHLLSPS
jgi:hypothetical protein